eukprot:GHVS01009996.1.p1 GENE.GHVS01009996.1~~GHVS01009996.1.p1  ORF type:complete len:404 (+),score=52.57 GHVS01009996.1:96-1214(+)
MSAASAGRRMAPVVESRLVELERLAGALRAGDAERVVVFHKRMKLCRQYYLLLHRMLYYALHKLCSDAIFEGERRYISVFLCVAYFRLPAFRSELLQCVLTGEERSLTIGEWRGTEYELDAETLTRLEGWQSECDQQLLFDWAAFHSSLRAYFGEANLLDGLKSMKQRAPSTTLWKERIAGRGSLFFSLLEQWSKHVYQTVSRRETLRWHTLPGYATLLKALLLEMKSREVTKYPDALLNCTGAMLANERLLSVFIKVLFLKTSVFHSPSVFCAMNYVDYWTQVLTLRAKPLPPNFDFNFLKKGLDIELGSDMCLNVAKGMWFIYKNIPVFQGDQLRAIAYHLMLRKYFLRLFLNWSWLVRKCYMWFLLYRI